MECLFGEKDISECGFRVLEPAAIQSGPATYVPLDVSLGLSPVDVEDNWVSVRPFAETDSLFEIVRPAEHGGDAISDASIAMYGQPVGARNVEEITIGNRHLYTPRFFKEIKCLPKWVQIKWRDAVRAELDNCDRKGVFKQFVPTKLPRGVKITGTRFVFLIKFKSDGTTIDKFKARLVVKGYTQRPGIDFNPDMISSPVVRPSTLMTMISYAAKYGWALYQADIDGAFLLAPIRENIYIRLPLGVVNGKRMRKLDKSLYGTKQAAANFFEELKIVLIGIGFVQSNIDP